MPTRLKKTRKRRGYRLHGWGVSGQHRDAGSQGGRGNAGRFKHRMSRLIREGVRIGKHGFHTHRSELRTINVGDLENLLKPTFVKDREKKTGQSVDLGKLGYQKLLGKGQIQIPIVVTIDKCSKLAAEKIEKAGGKISPAT